MIGELRPVAISRAARGRARACGCVWVVVGGCRWLWEGVAAWLRAMCG